MKFLLAGKVRRGQMLPDNDALVQVIKLRPEILQQMLQVIIIINHFGTTLRYNNESNLFI